MKLESFELNHRGHRGHRGFELEIADFQISDLRLLFHLFSSVPSVSSVVKISVCEQRL